MRTKTYKLIGDPIAWTRTGVKFSTRKIYDAQKNDKLIIGLHFQKQHNDEPLFTSPIIVDMKFFFSCPRTKLKVPYWYSIPPDVDNLEKFYADCMKNSIIYDDKLIVKLSAEKRYARRGQEPYSLFTITEATAGEPKPTDKISMTSRFECRRCGEDNE